MIDPRSPRARYVVLGLLMVAQIGSSLIQQGLGALTPFFVSALDLDKTQLGTLFTALMLGSSIFLTPGGIIVDRVGERMAILASGVLMGLSLTLGALIPTYAGLLLALFLVGVFYAPTTPAGGTAILSWFKRDRGLAMGIRQTGVPLGAALGGFVFPALAAHGGYRAALVWGGLICIVACVIATSLYRENKEMRAKRQHTRAIASGIWEFARDPRVLYATAACMILVSAQQSMNSFVAVTAINDGLAIGIAAATFACGQLAAAFGRIFWGSLSDLVFHGDRMIPIVLIQLTMAVATLSIALIAPHRPFALFVAVALLGASGSGWNGLYAAIMAEIGGSGRAGTALGVGLTAIFAAGAIAPSLFGMLADALGLHAGWTALAILGVVGVIPALLGRRAMQHAALPRAASPSD